MNKVIHRDWGDTFLALIYKAQGVNLLWIRRFYACQRIFLGINQGQETILRLAVVWTDYFLLRGFFLGLGREDLGTASTALMASCNRSNGVFSVAMLGMIPVSLIGVYNDPPDNSTMV